MKFEISVDDGDVDPNSSVMDRFCLTEAQWKKMQPFWLGKSSDPGRTGGDARFFTEAVLWIARTGSPWRDLPDFYRQALVKPVRLGADDPHQARRGHVIQCEITHRQHTFIGSAKPKFSPSNSDIGKLPSFTVNAVLAD